MSRKCEICGKGQVSGNSISHSVRHTRRKWNANIQTVRIDDEGTVRKAKVCTRCLRSGKVNRAIQFSHLHFGKDACVCQALFFYEEHSAEYEGEADDHYPAFQREKEDGHGYCPEEKHGRSYFFKIGLFLFFHRPAAFAAVSVHIHI